MLARLSLLCIWVTLASGGPFQPDVALDRLRADADAALVEGRFADAAVAARALVAAAPAASIAHARAADLLVEALVGQGEAAAASTLALAQEALKEKEALRGRGDPDIAVSLHNLAAVRVERGEAALARPLDLQALTLRLRAQAPPAHIADSRERLARTLLELEQFDAAAQQAAGAIALREREADAHPLALARALELIAWVHLYRGQYALARAPLDRVLALRAQAPEHPDLARFQQLLGDLHWLQGDGPAAIRDWTSAMHLVERRLGAEHPAMVGIERRLAFANDGLGNRLEAGRLLDAALALSERTLAPCNHERLATQGDAAGRSAYDGAFVEARRQYVAARRAFERCVGAHHSDTATVVYNLALLATRMGNLAEAEQLHRQTIREWSAGLGRTHPFVIRGWEGLAEVAAARGQHAEARALYERVLAARRRADEPAPALIAWTLTNLGQTLADSGDLARADAAVGDAIGLFRGAGAAEDPDHLARALALSGEIQIRRGRLAAGRSALDEALSARTRIFGGSHPLTARARADVAAAALQAGDLDAALAGALAAEDIGRDHLRFTIRYLPERQAMQYAANRPKGLDVALSTGAAMTARAGNADVAAQLLDAVVRSRGVILEELAARARTTRPPDPVSSPIVARAAAARQRYANLVVRSLQESLPADPTGVTARLNEARREKEDAEQALAEQTVVAGADATRSGAGLEAVRAALPADSALVSFVRYDRTRLAAGAVTTRWRAATPVSYAAFVLRTGGGAATLVPLGPAAAIDALVADWRREASGQRLIGGAAPAEAERTCRAAGLRLRRAIWDPLSASLTGAGRIFIVPDGQLNVVSFAALPARNGRFLADEPVVLHYISTERDLAMPAAPAAPTGLLAVGGATFDGQQTPLAEAAAERSACEAFSRMRFLALPGSRREVADITRAWPAADASAVTVLSGGTATETAVKRGVAGRRVVHLATHGFFLGGECVPGVAGTRGVGGLARRRAGGTTDTDNPLLLSGLALAWANRRDKARTREDDGILTAEEIAGLNLQGTEWAVLSACDTGLGEIRAGEGVFGLRRAFQVAGARTVIMSLWSVEDTSARVWMRALYDGRFRQQRSTADAVHDASRTVLAARRARGESTHPFFWAGFVAAGDWR